MFKYSDQKHVIARQILSIRCMGYQLFYVSESLFTNLVSLLIVIDITLHL